MILFKPMINDEDKAEFERAMRGVKRLDARQQKIHRVEKSKKAFKMQPKKRQVPEPSKIMHHFVHPKEDPYGRNTWAGSEEAIVFARSGVQPKTMKQFEQGQVRIDRKLDLHGYTVDEALDLLQTTLENCQQTNVRVLLLIHGKGHFSAENAPILKNVLNQWLRQSPLVIAFHSAQPKHGGAGALYVLIKTKR